MNTIKVRTTQNVEVAYAIASVGDRIVAHLIDLAVYVVWVFSIAFIMAGIGNIKSPLFYILLSIPLLFYHLLCEIFFNGQSIGKKARDIKVIKLSGAAPSIGDYLLRWMFRLIDTGISYGLLALVTAAISNKGQRLGDMAAGTCVIKTKAVKPQTRFQVEIEEDYQIQFPQVNVLTDEDVALIRKLLSKAQEHSNYNLLEKIAERVKDTTGIQTDMADWQFLVTIIKDYQHYTYAMWRCSSSGIVEVV
ncbi:RDD family protein [Pontibacter sp. 13R65]|uniref:RDD family protein n=1 Tax=Pontibacter sp. 13R65 TaxID=3127458 RepID=UPI00301D21BB